MTSSRPYLIRAIYQWIVDNGLTPHLLVNAGAEHVQVPTQYVDNGKIVLNISPGAVKDLDLGNDWVMFNARFAGTAMDLSFPPSAVLAIYAKENGQGMLFNEEEGGEPEPPEPPAPKPGRPSLKVVK